MSGGSPRPARRLRGPRLHAGDLTSRRARSRQGALPDLRREAI